MVVAKKKGLKVKSSAMKEVAKSSVMMGRVTEVAAKKKNLVDSATEENPDSVVSQAKAANPAMVVAREACQGCSDPATSRLNLAACRPPLARHPPAPTTGQALRSYPA